MPNKNLEKCPETCYTPKKVPKNPSYFENCAILIHSAQFRGLVRPFFGNVTCLRTLFWRFLGWSFNFKSDICLSTCYIVKKWLKKLSDFEYLAVLTLSAQIAQIWGFIWPFFGNKTCLRTLVRGYWGWSFNFWIDICP